ncbi:MAG: polysaccharide deacetylase family protein [Clostridia bacterium]|nr:polysaccharide deacetylase family protein [Clostridia bacterium]
MVRIRRILILAALVPLLSLSLFCGVGAKPYRKSTSQAQQIALTFDDGPSIQNTEEILGILKEYGIRATFFVIGENAAADPERIRMIHEAGHEIGNHTYTHAYISKIGKDALREEIQKTENVLKEITGEKPCVFRPPGGLYNEEALTVLEEMGYRSILWSLDTRDWSMPKSDTIVSKIEENAVGGDIILFHDLNDKRLPTPEALKQILPYLKENGYEFVTISEMIENEAG